jgi:hypothetical protein
MYADQTDEAEPSHRTGRNELVIVPDDARRESADRYLLRVLCLGIVGLIAADLPVLVYFWVI